MRSQFIKSILRDIVSAFLESCATPVKVLELKLECTQGVREGPQNIKRSFSNLSSNPITRNNRNAIRNRVVGGVESIFGQHLDFMDMAWGHDEVPKSSI